MMTSACAAHFHALQSMHAAASIHAMRPCDDMPMPPAYPAIRRLVDEMHMHMFALGTQQYDRT